VTFLSLQIHQNRHWYQTSLSVRIRNGQWYPHDHCRFSRLMYWRGSDIIFPYCCLLIYFIILVLCFLFSMVTRLTYITNSSSFVIQMLRRCICYDENAYVTIVFWTCINQNFPSNLEV
jgi:hypothetical protein